MLSRTADNLYWLARYVERAEYLARILEATQRAPRCRRLYRQDQRVGIRGATAGGGASFFRRPQEANEETVTDFLAFSPDNPSSIRNCFEVARTMRARCAPRSPWRCGTPSTRPWLELQELGTRHGQARGVREFLRCVQESSLRFDGSAYRTMLRNDAYWFSRLGVYIGARRQHRAHPRREVSRAAAARRHVGGPLDYYQWAAILRSVSALTAYHWVYRESLKPWLIADLLILNDRCRARSRAATAIWCATSTRSASPMAARAPAQRHARGVRNRLNTATWTISSRTACMNSSRNSFIADKQQI